MQFTNADSVHCPKYTAKLGIDKTFFRRRAETDQESGTKVGIEAIARQ
jgi:hypothetical protein